MGERVHPPHTTDHRAPSEGQDRTHWEGCYTAHGHHGCALAEIQRLRAELAEVKYWNGAIAVCQEHVEDIVSEDPASCVVCDLERLRTAPSEQEPEKAFRAGVSYGVDFADAHDPADGFGGPSEEWQKAKYTDWLARTQSPKEGDDE